MAVICCCYHLLLHRNHCEPLWTIMTATMNTRILFTIMTYEHYEVLYTTNYDNYCSLLFTIIVSWYYYFNYCSPIIIITIIIIYYFYHHHYYYYYHHYYSIYFRQLLFTIIIELHFLQQVQAVSVPQVQAKILELSQLPSNSGAAGDYGNVRYLAFGSPRVAAKKRDEI